MRRAVAVGCVLGALAAASCSGDDGAHREQVEIFGSYRGRDADLFVESLRAVPTLRDVEIRYTGSRDFVADLRSRVLDDADLPDIAMVAQPGVVRELVDAGTVEPLGTSTIAALDEHYTEEARALGQVEGEQLGVPYRLTAKSLVWYRPSVFAAHGWTVPTTWDELVTLVEDIDATEDIAPWCFAIQAGTATGWAATDWVEDIVLVREGPEVYDRWVDGEVPFADADIEDAFDTFQALVLSSGRSAGGRETILQTPVDKVAKWLVEDPPPCALYKQADFALGWFPDGISIGPEGDVAWFVLPGVEPDHTSVVVGGDVAVAFDGRAAVEAVMTVLASPEGSAAWRRSSPFVSPLESVLDEQTPGPIAEIAAAVAAADVVRFDASDSMPAAVGTTPYWEAITRWIAGSIDFQRLAEDLDTRRSSIPTLDSRSDP